MSQKAFHAKQKLEGKRGEKHKFFMKAVRHTSQQCLNYITRICE